MKREQRKLPERVWVTVRARRNKERTEEGCTGEELGGNGIF